jgi:hypothetical protein
MYKNWDDDENDTPVARLMREMADDIAPHLNGMPDGAPEVRQLRNDCERSLCTASRRAPGDAAETRKKNTARGINQKGLTGSTKQKRWASEIRGKMISAPTGDDDFSAVVRNATAARFWIDNRNIAWNDLARRYIRLVTTNNAAVEAANAIGVTRGLSAGERATFDACDKAKIALDAFLRR